MTKTRVHIALACLAVLISAAVSQAMIPRTSMAETAETLDLVTLIPLAFGEWAAVPDIRLVEPPGDTLSREIYNQELARGYSDAEGHIVMLLIAYGVSQSDRLQLHRPEICYAAQGFAVSRPTGAELLLQEGRSPLPVTRLIARREGRFEPVSYWMRIGRDVATGVFERQLLKVKYGLQGLIPDGALVRVSTIGVDEKTAFELQSAFIRDLVGHLGPSGKNFLVGHNRSGAP